MIARLCRYLETWFEAAHFSFEVVIARSCAGSRLAFPLTHPKTARVGVLLSGTDLLRYQ